MLKNIHTQDDIKTPVNIQREKITKDHGFADVGLSECKREMAHLRSKYADAGIGQETNHRACKAPQLKAAASPQTTNDRRANSLIVIDHRAPHSEPVVKAM